MFSSVFKAFYTVVLFSLLSYFYLLYGRLFRVPSIKSLKPLPNKSLHDLYMEREIKLYRNLPIQLILDRHTSKFWRGQNVCGKFPRIYDIRLRNTQYQSLNTTNQTVLLHGAYYDDRIVGQPFIRLIAGGRFANGLPPMFCQMWYKDQKHPVEVPVAWSRYLHGNGVHGHWHPEMFFGHLITCPIPEEVIHKVPDVVTMVANSCDKSYNALKVWNERPNKMKDFAICVKSVWSPFKDNTKALVEWIEINIAQGVKSIQMYVQTITPNARKVLEYYEQLGLVEILQMEWPGSVPTSASPWLQQWYYPNVTWIHSSFDHYAYNDCLYRNLYKFQYIALLDVDELLMPTRHKKWQGLFQELKNKGNDPMDYSSIMFYHLYFFGNKTGQSQTGHAMLDSDLRTTLPIPQAWQIKGFFNTQRNLIVFNHYTIACITEPCETFHVGLSMGQLNHYRSDCVKVSIITPEICNSMKNNLTQDTLAKRYEDSVVINVLNTFEAIDFDPVFEG